MSQTGEWSKFVAVPKLGAHALFARHIKHAYERHSHDFYVIGIVDGGAPSFSLGRKHVIAPAGTAMIINPGEAHDGRPSDSSGYVYSMVYVDEWVVREIAVEIGRGLSNEVEFNQAVVADREIVRRVFRLHRALMEPRDGLEREVLLVDALKELICRYASPRLVVTSSGACDPRIERARDFIHANFADPITTRDLAAASGLGRARLNDLFREAHGLPLHAYLNSVRMNAARKLLSDGGSAAQVAAAVGLSDQSHLIRRFKGSFGITPKQFDDAVRQMSNTPTCR